MALNARRALSAALLLSGVAQLALALAFRGQAGPEDCRRHGDCAGEALTLWLVAGPLAVLGLANVALAFGGTRLRPWWLPLAWLALSWAYAGYWLLALPEAAPSFTVDSRLSTLDFRPATPRSPGSPSACPSRRPPRGPC